MSDPISNPFFQLEKSEVETEEKNGFTYTSWAEAWRYAKMADPEASADFHTFDHARQVGDEVVHESKFMTADGFVQVSTTIFGITHTMQLPVKDYKNDPIKNPHSMQINTNLMRCLAKSLALHGIGLHAYRGEDLPEEPTFSPQDLSRIRKVYESADISKKEMGRLFREEANKEDPDVDRLIETVKSYDNDAE